MKTSAITKQKRKESQIKIFDVINFIILGLFTLICIYPFYYLIINTISSNVLSGNGDIIFFPRQIQFSNYIQVIKIPGLMNAAYISVARTVLGTILPVLVSSFLGFMFTQKKMWNRKLWYRYVLITMYFNAGLIPWYITMMNLGLLNNFWAYILPALIQPFNIILTKTYIESTPITIQEAAVMDGAGILTIFWYIILPIIKPILATIAIFCAVGQWNSFMDTIILMTNQNLNTLQSILYKYINQADALASMLQGNNSISGNMIHAATTQTAGSVRMTVTVIVVLPILMVYPFFQRSFVKGIMLGSIKG
ncbi:MAG TPA: carbohydrate ABC transporter permease [Ruminiclostridium sp.]